MARALAGKSAEFRRWTPRGVRTAAVLPAVAVTLCRARQPDYLTFVSHDRDAVAILRPHGDRRIGLRPLAAAFGVCAGFGVLALAGSELWDRIVGPAAPMPVVVIGALLYLAFVTVALRGLVFTTRQQRIVNRLRRIVDAEIAPDNPVLYEGVDLYSAGPPGAGAALLCDVVAPALAARHARAWLVAATPQPTKLYVALGLHEVTRATSGNLTMTLLVSPPLQPARRDGQATVYGRMR